MPVSDPSARRRYHHGDLRRALLDAAVEALAEVGAAGVNLRALARRAGVSHAAPAHHFGDKTGLLTAVAAEGHELLAEALAEAWARTGEFREVGVAYVRFAVDHPGHFEVMFSPEVLDVADPALVAASAASTRQLYGPLAAELGGSDADGEGGRDADGASDAVGASDADARAHQLVHPAVAAWSLAHGLAALWRNGALPPTMGTDIEAEARAVLGHLFTPLAPGGTGV